jgi:hypothetical protein
MRRRWTCWGTPCISRLDITGYWYIGVWAAGAGDAGVAPNSGVDPG